VENVDAEAVERVAEALETEHRGHLAVPRRQPPDTSPTQSMVDEAIRRAITMLPDGTTWAIAKDEPSVIGLAPGDTIFIVKVLDDWIVQVLSQPLNGERLTVECVTGPPAPTDTRVVREVGWTFRYRGQADDQLEGWQKITGWTAVNQDRHIQIDHREALARAIASRVGWNVAG
jgi:hypothetical protein